MPPPCRRLGLREDEIDRHEPYQSAFACMGICEELERLGLRARSAAHDEEQGGGPRMPCEGTGRCGPSVSLATIIGTA
jgi:hypothetical protein